MITQDLKDYFFRHFLGRVKVKSLSPVMEAPRIFFPKRGIAVHPVRTRIETTGSVLYIAERLVCSSRSFRFAAQLVRVRGAKIARYALGDLKTRTVPKLETKTRENVRRASVLPQERTNRLQWQTRPKRDGNVIHLAWFGPIIEEAVLKLTLNKRQGTLLIWYNPQSRRFEAKGLYLCRRLGSREGTEWRWDYSGLV
ncbi:MAG: hypothetical protein LBL51_01515 [Synergistaceae bacterium]|nr:hypothetical protein [Synergistaceae bacterium]